MENELKVTFPLIPSIKEIEAFITEICHSGHLTNRGAFHLKLEKELCRFLGVNYISLVSSGTTALILALKSQNLSGEVLTTPFTHISTIQAIRWNGLKPVFVDIERSSLNMDPYELEKAIGPNTSAILPTHIFGIPCKLNELERIAIKYDLKIIYDAAHCFGVKVKDESILNYGDLSILSFHATKIFNTIEGGAIISRDSQTKKLLDSLSNFGFDNNEQLVGNGLNGKMNEIQAAFGLASLKHVNAAIENRMSASKKYRKLLKKIPGVVLIDIPDDISYNHSYFPIVIDKQIIELGVHEILEYLNSKNIYPKRYFYPLSSEESLFRNFRKNNLSNSIIISENIICLPLSHRLSMEDVEYIVNSLNDCLGKN